MTDRALHGALLLLIGCSLGAAQGLTPSTPAKEYVYLNGQVVAVENAVPQAGAAASRPTEKQPKTSVNQPAASGVPAVSPSLLPHAEAGASSLPPLPSKITLFLPGIVVPSGNQSANTP